MDPNAVKEHVARSILVDAALDTYYEARKQADTDSFESDAWRCFGEALRGIELWICRVYHHGFPPEQADRHFMEDYEQRLGLDSQAPSEIIDRELGRRPR